MNTQMNLATTLREAATMQPFVEAYGGGHDIVLNQRLYDGENLVVHVQQLAHDTFKVSDLGQVAGSLNMRGVDLEQSPASRSWHWIQSVLAHGAHAPMPTGSDDDPWELRTFTDLEGMSDSFVAVSEAMLRADGLGQLASNPRKQSSFVSRVQTVTARAGLEIHLKPKLKTRSGISRHAHLIALAPREEFYIQALTRDGGNIGQTVNNTFAMFADSEMSKRNLVAVTEHGVRKSHLNLLDQVATVVPEPELSDYWQDQVAA